MHAGRKTMSPAVAAELAEHSGEDLLTPREIDVLRLVALGLANKEIASRMGSTEDTIKSRVKNILAKLNAKDRTHAVMLGAAARHHHPLSAHWDHSKELRIAPFLDFL